MSNVLKKLSNEFEMAQFVWRDLTTNNRPISVYRGLIEVVGNVKSAVLLSQMVYWTRFGRDIETNDGWFFKNSEQFSHETGLSRKEQLTARRNLVDSQIIEVQQRGLNRVNWYRVNFEALRLVLSERFEIDMSASNEVVYGNGGLGLVVQFLGRPLPYHTILAKITGSINSGLMLSLLMHNYFKNKNQKVAGYITKHIDQWQIETGLSYKEQKHARDLLCNAELQIISEHHLKLSREIYTSINFNNLYTLFTMELYSKNSGDLGSNSGNMVHLKRDLLGNEKGPTHSAKRSNTISPKGEIPSSPLVKYHGADTSNNIVPKGEIVYIDKITGSKNTVKEDISIPQPQPTQQKISELNKSDLDVVVVSNDKLKPHIDGLHWPYCFQSRELKDLALAKLDVCRTDVQTLLDEISGNELNGIAINNPLRYLSRLIELDRSGQFYPDVAHKVKYNRDKASRIAAMNANQNMLQESEREILSSDEFKKRMQELLKKTNKRIVESSN